MKQLFKIIIKSGLSLLLFSFIGCNNVNERDIVSMPTTFQVAMTSDTILKGINNAPDTFVVKRNNPIYFKFNGEIPDQILFFSGIQQQEYRFSNRQMYSPADGTQFDTKINLTTRFNNSGNVNGSVSPTTGASFYLCAYKGLYNDYSEKSINTLQRDTLMRLQPPFTNADWVNPNPFSFSTGVSVKGVQDYQLGVGLINLVLTAKCDDAYKNWITLKTINVTATETRNYGYNHPLYGLVTNTQTINYVILGDNDANQIINGQKTTATPYIYNFVMYTPTKSINSTGDTLNTAVGYSFPLMNMLNTSTKPMFNNTSNSPLLLNDYGVRIQINPAASNNTFIISEPDSVSALGLRTHADTLKAMNAANLIKSVKLAGSNPPAAQTVLNRFGNQVTIPYESWLISRPINPAWVMSDTYTTAVKNMAQNAVLSTSYTYTTPGIYTATFQASNIDLSGAKTVLRQFVILVKK